MSGASEHGVRADERATGGEAVPPPPPRRRRARIGAILAAALVLAGLALIGASLWLVLRPAPALPAPPERVVAESVAEQSTPIPAAPPTSLRIPVIRFEASVLPMAVPDDGVVYPPTDRDAFWLEDFGMAGADAVNTAYIAGHSSADGGAVFDPLIDRAQGGSTLQAGDEIVVTTANGDVVYHVSATVRYERSSLPDIDDVWTQSPGRLVIITCLFEGTNTSTSENLVVFARIAPGSAG